MSAQITIAKKSDGLLIHINDVDINTKKNQIFSCVECNSKLTTVKTDARKKDWHFRHIEDADLSKCRSTALHDYAVQILCEHNELCVSKTRRIKYTDAKKEVSIGKFRSDVMVIYNGINVHIEVFVTHDLAKDKIEFYTSSKIHCIKIDLSDKALLIASKEKIVEEVLNQHRNNTIIYWEDLKGEIVEKSIEEKLFGIGVVGLIIFGLYKIVTTKPKNRRRS